MGAHVTCRQLIEFIGDYVDGTLDAAAREEFERHLNVCPTCRSYLETYRKTMLLARTLLDTEDEVVDVPEELIQTILSRI